MQAMVCTQYGSPDVLKLQEVAKPVPKDNEILIRIHATTVTSGDCRVRGFKSPLLLWLPMRLFLGLRKPRKAILGVELAGEVEETGKHVTRYKKGDRVFAFTGMRFGAHAEYICLPEAGLVASTPASVADEDAVAILFGGTTAMHFLRKGKLQIGHNILVYGASGAVGTSVVQLAKHFGAHVTAVCSAANHELVQSLGADRVIDYRTDDFTKSGMQYDLVFDAVGKTKKSHCTQSLTPNGTYVTVDGQGIAKVLMEDLLFLTDLLAQGKLQPVIDRRYPLDQIPDAHRYVETGHKKGNIIISLA
ncbi:NADPH:quinone reductase-like Zn-dependent oxidoreductase [Tumebacillus sp. BK434]|uniref:NAD(P)-dependent alcohol dehydrogenase n=1 Tax=Tumebacillus sp. BK434 TaxID=2512169 RepID=UPI00104AAE64|nr:NAD(P)-dependent alcohol dehydrogenase [Tumebacillus sp. BK434]TCP59206.1 NADPH:quinone reductase-like Zn-dependent oxidoreductase [Tumebacillus sp. BK434]